MSRRWRATRKNEWTWVKGGGEHQSSESAVVAEHAVELACSALDWTQPSPQHGFDKPQLTITFTTSPDDKSSHRLFVGSAAGDGTWFARVDEREGTFVISNSDFNTRCACPLPLRLAARLPAAAGANAIADFFTERRQRDAPVITSSARSVHASQDSSA